MHTYCRSFVLIDSICADFMHTDSVLYRLFEDLAHTLLRVNVFHSDAAARPAGAHRPFLRGRRNSGGGAMAAATAGSYALVGDAAAAAGAARAVLLGESGGRRRHHHDFLGRSAAVSRPLGTAAAGCGGCKMRGGALLLLAGLAPWGHMGGVSPPRAHPPCAHGAALLAHIYHPSWDKQESSNEASSPDSLCVSVTRAQSRLSQ
jgi:hypothetical protein